MEDMEQKRGDFKRAVQLLEKSGALLATVERARDYGRKALDELSIFPESEFKQALIEATNFAVNRSY